MKWTEYPLIPIPDRGQLEALLESDGPQAVYDLWNAREEAIFNAEDDPVKYGIELPQQKELEQLIKDGVTEAWVHGGNRSSKSYQSAKMVMRALLENPGTTIICWAQNEEASVEMQQPYLFKMLPPDLRKKIKSEVGNISYNEKTGFTGKKFVLPNGSKCLFRFYSQFLQNEKMIEGYTLGLKESECKYINVGTWLDEYYMDEKLIGRLRRRCNDNNAVIISSFTPLDGFTPLIAKNMKDARVEKTLYASLLGREMPYVMKPKKRNSCIVFFHTERNPFTNFDRLKLDLEGCSEEEIMTVAYGYPVKSITTLLPLFNTEINVLGDEPNSYGMSFPKDISNEERYTCYMVLDHADARNHCAIWACVDGNGDVYIVDEWPRRETYGEWAIFGSPKWKYGPAAKKIGHDVDSYVQVFTEVEQSHGLNVFERIADSRAFAREDDHLVDKYTLFSERGMDFVPADGRKEAIGISALDDWFNYNPNNKVDAFNKPKCFIHERCGNLIASLTSYGAKGQEDAALKDFFDLMRYLRLSNNGEGPEHYDDKSFEQVKPCSIL